MAVSPGGRAADDSPLGTKPLFGVGGLTLPRYVRMVAHAMILKGHGKSEAIQLAIGIIRNWAEGKGDVRPQVRAAAVKAIAEWTAAKARARATPNR